MWVSVWDRCNNFYHIGLTDQSVLSLLCLLVIGWSIHIECFSKYKISRSIFLLRKLKCNIVSVVAYIQSHMLCGICIWVNDGYVSKMLLKRKKRYKSSCKSQYYVTRYYYCYICGCLMFLRLNLDYLPTYQLLEYNEVVKITSK